MSVTMKWVVGIVVAVTVLFIFWEAMRGTSSGTVKTGQPAAAAAATSNTVVTQAVANIDTQLTANATDMASLSKAVSLATSTAVVQRLGSIGSEMVGLSGPLQAIIVTAQKAGKSITAASAALDGMKNKVSSAISIIVNAKKDLSVLNPSKGAANDATLKRTLISLQSAASYLQGARADIQTIVQATM